MIKTIREDPETPFQPPEVPTAEWIFRSWLDGTLAAGRQAMAAHLLRASELGGVPVRSVPTFPTFASLRQPLRAYVNHGRWVWDCPVCNAAQVCDPEDPRAFCVECFNASEGFWSVDFPDPQTRARADELLSRRPIANRNWYPGREPLQQLQAENVREGIDPDLSGLEWIGGREGLAMARGVRELGYEDAKELLS